MNLLAAEPFILQGAESGVQARRWIARILRDRSTVIVDTETLDFGALMCEIAAIDTSGNVLLDTLVNPGSRHRMHPEAHQVHGITMDELEHAPGTETVLKKLVALTANSAHVMAYNADYDRNVIARDGRRVGIDLDRLNDPDVWGCVMRARSAAAGHPESYLPLRGGHRALSDCRATLAVMHAIGSGV